MAIWMKFQRWKITKIKSDCSEVIKGIQISKVKDYKAKSDCSEVINDTLVEGHDTGVKILLWPIPRDRKWEKKRQNHYKFDKMMWKIIKH